MKRLLTVFSAVLLSIATGSALGAEELPAASSLPKNVVQISPVIPGMGEHWANPKDLPLGPIYGVSEGRVIFLEFMIARATLAKGKSFTELASKAGIKLPPVDHVDIDWEPKGHHGFAVPHYDIHLYFVPHAKHMVIKPNA